MRKETSNTEQIASGANAEPIRAVIFDFDLTLADSTRGVIECVETALHRMDMPCPDDADILSTVGLSLARSFERLTGVTDAVRAERFCELFRERADEVMASLTSLYAPVPRAIRHLRAAGTRTAIVSTKFRYRIESILARENVSQLFDLVVGSEDVRCHKPHPEGLLRALSELRLTPRDVVYVGDHPVDAQAARDAGIRFYAVLTGVSTADDFVSYPVAGFLASLEDVIELPAQT